MVYGYAWTYCNHIYAYSYIDLYHYDDIDIFIYMLCIQYCIFCGYFYIIIDDMMYSLIRIYVISYIRTVIEYQYEHHGSAGNLNLYIIIYHNYIYKYIFEFKKNNVIYIHIAIGIANRNSP